jgi:double-stranded uracil-DNA glycosylase
MNDITGFRAESDTTARVLIIGSMPGQRSLNENRYYAHPRNTFWKIMGELFDAGPEHTYLERLAQLRKQRIALWDVLQQCERQGSLDSAIRPDAAVVNDFANFFKRHNKIHSIFFNGKKAYEIYTKHYPDDPHRLIPLPSTSPANAAISFAEKLECWSVVRDSI